MYSTRQNLEKYLVNLSLTAADGNSFFFRQSRDLVIYNIYSAAIKTSKCAVSFWGISRLCSAVLFLPWFKLAHVYIQVTIVCTNAMKLNQFAIFQKQAINFLKQKDYWLIQLRPGN